MSRPPDPAEDSVAFRVAVLVTLVVAALAAVQQGVGGPVLLIVVLLGYPAAFLVAYVTRHARPAVLRAVITMVAMVVLLVFLASVAAQPVIGLASLQVPLAEVFVWLMLLHAVDSPGRRGLFLSLLASVVLIALAGVLSISMAIAPFVVAWLVAGVSALVLAQRADLARLPALDTAPDRTVRTAVRGATAVAVSLVAMVGLAGGIFMVAPVAGTDRSLTFPAQLPQSESVPVLGGLSNPSLGADDPARPVRPGDPSGGGAASFGYFGFSTELDTATRGRPDNTLVMRVRASAPDFWRGQTFDVWDGRVWRASEPKGRTVRGGQPIPIPTAFDDGPPVAIVDTDELVQTYYIEEHGPNAIFAAATPTRLYFSDRTVFQLPDGSLRAGVQLEGDSVYTVVSRRRLATATALRASDPLGVPQRIRDKYASPPVITDRVRALAQAVTANAPTTYDKVRALERWMGENTQYTLNIPPLPRGQDAVDRFLFVDKRGFCEQIGTSLVVMLRSLGIPARLTVGYATGERNPFTGLYEVRAKDAHAWAEVYFPGVGWQGFDPTAQVPLAGDSALDAAGTGALAYLNARIPLPDWAPPAAGIVVALVALVIVGLGIGRRIARRPARVAPTWAGTRLARLDRLGERRGRGRAPGETTPEFAGALTDLDPELVAELRTIAERLDADMYSGAPLPDDRRATVDRALDEVEARYARAGRSD